MVFGIKIGDLMTRNFVYVSPDTDLRECSKVMIKKRVGSLIISEKDRLRGILTEKDIIWAVVKKSKDDLKNIKASDIMKRKVVTIKPSSDVEKAIKLMRKKKVRRLPVVDKGIVIGMITLKDILKIDPALFGMISENVKIREETKKLKKRDEFQERREGICSECGENDLLISSDGRWICLGCYDRM